MMCGVLFVLRILLAVQLLPAQLDPAAPTPAAPTAAAPATQPATQPTAGQASAPQRRSAYDTFSESDIGQIIQGKKELTLKEILTPAFWYDTIRNLVETLLLFIPRLLGTLLFLFVFWLIYRGIRRMAVGRMKRGEVDSSIRDMLATLIRWCVMGFGIVIACNQLGIPIVAMLTGVSIIGLAVGFAAQETLANFIAGIVVFLDKPFKIGDWITVDGTFGQVRRVSFRSTRIVNLDGEVIVFPNTFMLANRVANHTTNPINRICLPIGISYGASIPQARRTLLALTENDERIVRNPAPEVVVTACADSSVNVELRFWIADESLERTIGYEYLEKMKNALDAANIQIPFPHVQLLVESTPAIESLAKSRASAA